MTQSARWSFAAFEIDTTAGVLRRDGEPVKIGRQAFRALALLVSRQGELVTREDLQKEIWGDRVHVDFEHGLNVCIRQVRLALADDTDGNPIVVTCPREGYRLGVPAQPVADTLPSRWTRWSAVASTGSAVLHRWGVAAAALSLVVAASVMTASFTWTSANVADRQAADAGTRRRSSTRCGSVAPTRCVRAPWPTGNSEAYAWYWRGRGYLDRATGRKPAWALPYFETAASLDSDFALAHASLTVSYLDRAATGVARTESLAKAKQAAERAVALGPQLPETHVALAELSYRSTATSATRSGNSSARWRSTITAPMPGSGSPHSSTISAASTRPSSNSTSPRTWIRCR